MSNTFSLAIATPTHRGLFSASSSYVRSVWGLQSACIGRGIPVELLLLPNLTMVDRARNLLASFFLHKTNFTHMLFLDDDMGFAVDDVMRMFEWHRLDVVAAMYGSKNIDWARIRDAVLTYPDADPSWLAQVAGRIDGMHTFLRDTDSATEALHTRIPVREIGTGIMLISRAYLERLIAAGIPSAAPDASSDHPVHEFFRQKVIDGRLVGEDFYFCNLVREHGGTVYGCAWPRTVHSGPYDFVSDVQAMAVMRRFTPPAFPSHACVWSR
ncbi:hypothetical protein BPMI_02057c [Candidatus Burkholderia pumila]|uniref:Glycosyltransferase n=1 Tax=Candidatus Burkholderia pumila TaxID=1090375 RepID=A0ABR5HPK0_9BURK|nr:hypothetical protein BPMI_02057c [Candidatus Burkholderia pumila]